jgi:hypothetical protein
VEFRSARCPISSTPANFGTAGGTDPCEFRPQGSLKEHLGNSGGGHPPGVSMAPAPAPSPAMDVEDEGVRDQNNTAVAKSEGASVGDVKDDGGLPIPPSKLAADPEVAPEPVEDKGGDTTECSSSFGNTFSGFDDEADGGEPEVNSQVLDPADGDLASMLPR